MADYNVGQYVLELWKQNHVTGAGHTVTRSNTNDGRVAYVCSCGNRLLVDDDKRSATDALAMPAKTAG